jgi:hypothetical protein
MLSRTIRRVAVGATLATASLTGLAATAHADGCIQIDDTTTRTAPTGEISVTKVCSIVNALRPPDPSTTNGRGYRLGDGSVLWLSEAEWWELLDRAAEDLEWREANQDLLVAVGILECEFVTIPAIKTIEIVKLYLFCEPTWDPRERLDWPVVQVRQHMFGEDDLPPGAPPGDHGSRGDPWRP